ncbi:GNAT family N-acetyltransferase [Pseudoalteromonas sp. SMS1]|uniref:GNAT family N-acetyltransferase n=1 Tax=Pseudoalteromonas sp. SMS1 TaxID=2908894 RepID=UPI001F421331|nr:GNAT family N-acetyltransferase [Pseudoalteromonas sp. SMS1]MCF2860031.1 GNAT family N-acetyltransferase [Pseudoalteromonas sp. SMS1]
MTICTLKQGWDAYHSKTVAALYETAFGTKFSAAIRDRRERIAVFDKCFLPEYSYAASVDDVIVGIAGFQTQDGALTGGLGFYGLIECLGLFNGLKAALIFSLFERKASRKELLLDGIAVNEKFRGLGIGSQLLDAVIAHAIKHNYQSVRLDVINSNLKARKLYEAKGFVATKSEYYPYLKWLVGFSGSTTMIYQIKET